MITTDLLHSYTNGNYKVSIHSCGTKVRICDEENFVPEFPESIDLKITNFCNLHNLCVFCHEQSNLQGTHADPDRIIEFAKGLPAGVEIAIGGGNPLSHPEFNYIIDELTKLGIVCNVTINQEHYEKFSIPESVHGVGISFRRRKKLNIKHNHIIHHMILGIHTYKDFLFLCQTYMSPKILWLGYKTVGNGITYAENAFDEIEKNISEVRDNLLKMQNHASVVAFDNLAIDQLGKDYEIFSQGDYMGDDGQYSFYFDAVKNEYAIGSSSLNKIDAKNLTAKEIFDIVRN